MTKQKTPPTPPLLRFIQNIFPTLEVIAPFLAKKLIVRLFFTPFRFKPREEELHMQSTGKRHEFDVNGNKVVAYSWGEGPIALLVHGWSGRGMQLRYLINPLLRNGYQVITFDAPGHGQSEGKQSTLIEFSDSVKAIREKFGPITVGIGHSLGGAALIYAIKTGLKLERLISIATPTIPDKIVDEFFRRINASQKMKGAIDNYVTRVTGHPFSYYSAIENITQVGDLPYLSFHDHNDKDAGIEHALKMKEVYPNMTLVETTGLGHNRILKNTAVIDRIAQETKPQGAI